jgi:hypothetical protein
VRDAHDLSDLTRSEGLPPLGFPYAVARGGPRSAPAGAPVARPVRDAAHERRVQKLRAA